MKRRRERPFWNAMAAWRLALPPLVVVATLVLGMIGFRLWNGALPWRQGLWHATGLLLGETSYASDAPQRAAVNAWLWAARILGLTIPFFAFLILARDWLHDLGLRMRVAWWVMLGRLVPSRRHVVLCGLGWRGSELAHQLRDARQPLVVIDSNPDSAFLAEIEHRGAIVLRGNAMDAVALRRAAVARAATVFVMAGDDERNCRIAVQIERLVSRIQRSPCLTVMAQLEHSTPQHGEGSPASVVCSTCRTHRHDGVACRVALNGYRMRTFLENSTRFGALNVDAFNIYELAARHALAASPLIDAQGKPGAPRHVHTVIVGATPAARAVLLETLRMLHLYDDQARVITVVAPDAETELRPTLYREYPCLDPSRASELGAVSSGLFPILEFVELPRSNATWMSEESRLGLHVEPNWRTNVFFCIDDGMKSRALAYTLTGWLSAAQQEAGPSCQTCISYFSDYPEEADLPFAVGVSAPDTRPRPIGCNVHQLLVHGAEERLARELSAMFLRRYPGPLTGVLPQSASEWDCFMRNYWATRSEWERDSNRQAADHIAVKLRLLGHGAASDAPITELRRQLWITEDEGGRITDASEPLKALAGVEHRRWCAERLLGGWQPLPMTPENLRRWFDAGHTQTKAARDAFRNRMKQNCRRHIDLVPFEQLKGDGFDERSKDYWTIAMIPALLDQVSVHKSVRGLQ